MKLHEKVDRATEASRLIAGWTLPRLLTAIPSSSQKPGLEV